MTRPLAILLIFATLLPSRAETISVGSRQFEAHAAPSVLAENAAERAESIRSAVYSLMAQPHHFIGRIRIQFEDAELGDSLEDFEYIAEAEPGIGSWEFSVKATKEASEAADTRSWPEAVVTAIQYEMANRVRGKKGGGLVRWPAWFLSGMTALSDIRLREEMGKLWEERYRRRTYRRLEQIWASTGSESGIEKERIQVLAAWLILRLRDLPDGGTKFAKLCYEINRGNFSAAVFQKIYAADFPQPESAEQWWTGQQASFRPGYVPAALDLSSTCAAVLAILEDPLPEPGMKGLAGEDLSAVNETHRQLMRLSIAGHPMAKPAIEAALRALDLLKANDTARARPAWENARSIVGALRPWESQIRAVLDRTEYTTDQLTSRQWLARKGLTD